MTTEVGGGHAARRLKLRSESLPHDDGNHPYEEHNTYVFNERISIFRSGAVMLSHMELQNNVQRKNIDLSFGGGFANPPQQSYHRSLFFMNFGLSFRDGLA